MLDLAIEKEVERPQEVGLPAPVGPDDRDDVVEGGECDPRKRAEILDANGADELDIGTLLVLAAGSLPIRRVGAYQRGFFGVGTPSCLQIARASPGPISLCRGSAETCF